MTRHVTKTRVPLPADTVATTTTTMVSTLLTGQMPRHLRVTLLASQCSRDPVASVTAEPAPRRVVLTRGTPPYREVWHVPGAGAVAERRRETRPRERHLLSIQVRGQLMQISDLEGELYNFVAIDEVLFR